MSKKKKDKLNLPMDDQRQLVDPFTGEALVPVEELQRAKRHIPEKMNSEEADRILQERIARGDIRLVDITRETKFNRNTIEWQLSQIKLDQRYLIDGSTPTGQPNEKTVLGSDLVFRHPGNKGTYIHQDLASGIKKRAIQKSSSPKKTEDWLTGKDFRSMPGGTSKKLIDIIPKVTALYDKHIGGVQEVQYGNQSIKLNQMLSGGRLTICIARTDWSKLAHLIGFSGKDSIPKNTNSWLTRDDIKYGGVSLPQNNTEAVKQTVEAVISKYDRNEGGLQQVEHNENIINVQRMQSGSHYPVCIAREDWPNIIEASKTEMIDGMLPKTEGWLSAKEITQTMPNANIGTVSACVRKVIDQYDIAKGGLQEIEVNRQIIRAQRFRYGRYKQVYIASEDWSKIILASGLPPELSSEWCTSSDTRMLAMGKNEEVRTLYLDAVSKYDKNKGGIQSIPVGDDQVRLQLMRSGTRKAVCVIKEDWQNILKAAGLNSINKLPEKSSDWLTATGDTKKMPAGKRKATLSVLKYLVSQYDTEQSGIQHINCNDYDIRLQQVQSGQSQRPICVAKKDWDKVLKAAEIEKVSPMNIESKSIKPDSEHIQERSSQFRRHK